LVDRFGIGRVLKISFKSNHCLHESVEVSIRKKCRKAESEYYLDFIGQYGVSSAKRREDDISEMSQNVKYNHQDDRFNQYKRLFVRMNCKLINVVADEDELTY
jgi:hypothetical protein